jgi:hypothetical protein
MRHDRYSVEASASLLELEFYSEGPKGRVKKRVKIVPFGNGSGAYNLAFGNVAANGEIDDLRVTNNNDSQKVLATVAHTAYDFFEKHPDCFIYAAGSTKARTRLYRMGITNNLAEITIDFVVYGFYDDVWEVFERGKDYEAFLIKKSGIFGA